MILNGYDILGIYIIAILRSYFIDFFFCFYKWLHLRNQKKPHLGGLKEPSLTSLKEPFT